MTTGYFAAFSRGFTAIILRDSDYYEGVPWGRDLSRSRLVPHIDNTFDPSFTSACEGGPVERGTCQPRNFAGKIPHFSNLVYVSTSAAERRKFGIGISTRSAIAVGILHKRHV